MARMTEEEADALDMEITNADITLNPGEGGIFTRFLKEPFDYTEWSREYFADYDPDQYLKDAVEYDKNNPV